MFNVVIGNNWCSVVPESWINNDKKTCLWPLNNINISKAIKEQLIPESSWKSTNIKYILGPYGKCACVRAYVFGCPLYISLFVHIFHIIFILDSYETARNIEKDAEFLSSDEAQRNTLSKGEINIIPLKRQRKPNNKYSPEEESSPKQSNVFL